jgi:hypothetical protein
VAYAQFQELTGAAVKNPWVICYTTDDGGHFGYDFVYGKAYVGRVLKLMLSREVRDDWLKRK